MASQSPWKRFQTEATCPRCLRYFTDPMILDCGHNLCFQCLARLSEAHATTARCPRCASAIPLKNFRENPQLAYMVQIAKELKSEVKNEGFCKAHGKPLKLFCEDDKAPICVVCEKGVEHQGHRVVPVKEAAQESKTGQSLETLKLERDKMLANKTDTERESQDLLKRTKAAREKAGVEFSEVHELLIEQEKQLLVRMEEAEEEIVRKRDDYLAKLSEQLASLERFIQEMELVQEAGGEILQDVENYLLWHQRRKLENPVGFPLEVKWLVWDFCDLNHFLEGIMRKFKGTLVYGFHLQKENISFDRYTANRWLYVWGESKRVQQAPKYKQFPSGLKRFKLPVVLGCEHFDAGRHFWDICVSSEEPWHLGVAKKSVDLSAVSRAEVAHKIWEIGKLDGVYTAYEASGDTVVFWKEELKRIRVVLNYEGRRVAFYDADRATFLYAFTDANFGGEIVRPWFYVKEKAHLEIPP